jgi:hypothetical protein
VRPDGRQLVSVSLDGTVKVGDAATGQEIRPSNVVPKYVSPVAFLALAHHRFGHLTCSPLPSGAVLCI